MNVAARKSDSLRTSTHRAKKKGMRRESEIDGDTGKGGCFILRVCLPLLVLLTHERVIAMLCPLVTSNSSRSSSSTMCIYDQQPECASCVSFLRLVWGRVIYTAPCLPPPPPPQSVQYPGALNL